MSKKYRPLITMLLCTGLMLSGCTPTKVTDLDNFTVEEEINLSQEGGTPSDSEVSLDNETMTDQDLEAFIEKSNNSNPITGFDGSGNLIYGGDPAALVDGDTVYLYTGHDVANGDSYDIPEWQCYSTTDMKNWSYEGVILKCSDISWASTKNSAWAAQTAKHYDPVAKKDKYYFYFCTWDKTSQGKQSIGVAVSDSPTGPFTDIGSPLVKGTDTLNQTSDWNDIDPTVWIETGEDGEEHRYLCWGNGKNYICELNDDMISVKDLDGDEEIIFGKDIIEKTAPISFTEAPWIYRQQDEDGKFYGKYYLFYAYGWRENIAYATTDNLISGEWEFGDVILKPTATSNTSHASIIDYKGETFFLYHNGSLSGGSGFRRVVCVEGLTINADGSIRELYETATGIFGTESIITDISGNKISHEPFTNSYNDAAYPYLNITAGIYFTDAAEDDCLWEIVPGKSDPTKEDYISIESYNKPGLYLTVGAEDTVVLSHTISITMKDQQTFHAVAGLSGDGISLESVSKPGYYITLHEGKLLLTDGSSAQACTFYVETR